MSSWRSGAWLALLVAALCASPIGAPPAASAAPADPMGACALPDRVWMGEGVPAELARPKQAEQLYATASYRRCKFQLVPHRTPVASSPATGVQPRPADHFAWHKWALGWLDDQMSCLATKNTRLEQTLTPVAIAGGRKTLVVRSGTTGGHELNDGACDPGQFFAGSANKVRIDVVSRAGDNDVVRATFGQGVRA